MDELNFDETDYSVCEDATDPVDTIINHSGTDLLHKTIDSDFYNTVMTRQQNATVQVKIIKASSKRNKKLGRIAALKKLHKDWSNK